MLEVKGQVPQIISIHLVLYICYTDLHPPPRPPRPPPRPPPPPPPRPRSPHPCPHRRPRRRHRHHHRISSAPSDDLHCFSNEYWCPEWWSKRIMVQSHTDTL